MIISKPSLAGRATRNDNTATKLASALKFKPYDTTSREKQRIKQSATSSFRIIVSSLMLGCCRYLAPVMNDSGKPSTSALTKHLLNTLSDESNPITHSDIGKRSGTHLRSQAGESDSATKDVIVSCVTGHQRGEGRRRKSYYDHRNAKLSEQQDERKEAVTKILDGVRLYIDGYLSSTTDIEMKRIVTMAGGQISCV